MTETLHHTRRRDCTRYGDPINKAHAKQRNGESVSRCPRCGAVLSKHD